MKENRKALLVFDSELDQKNAIEVLTELKYKTVIATNSSEARLKFANEKFDLLIVDDEIKNFKGPEYIEGIRRKEQAKNIKDIIPALIITSSAEIFSTNYSALDQVKFLERPFSNMQLKKALLTLSGNDKNLNENTKFVEAGEFLITEGGTNHEMYWVMQGRFQVIKMNQQDQNVIIGEVRVGELLGEMSFLDNLPRSASVKALEDSEVLVIPHRKFIDVLDGQPRWFRSLMQTMSQRLRKANEKITQKQIKKEE